MIYLLILSVLILLAFRYDVCDKRGGRDFWYNMMLFVFILVAGLRWRIGIDTPPYIYRFYHECPSLENWSLDGFSLTDSPLYDLVCSIVKSLGGKFYIVQLIHASFINILIFHFIKKYTRYIFTTLFFYALLCYTTYNMEIMRGSLSIVICLFANDYILEKKWIKGYSLYVIALLFHAQTIVMFILPLFFFLRFNKWGFLACIGAFMIGKIIMEVMVDYMFLIETDEGLANKVSVYAESDTYGTQNAGFIFQFYQMYMPIIYIILSFLFLKCRCAYSKVLKLEPFLLIGVCFLLVRTNLEIAYRYVDFYKIYFALLFSEFFVEIIKKSNRLNVVLAYVRSWIVFIPFVYVFGVRQYMIDGKGLKYRYVPYSSVIDRSISKERELKYKELNAAKSFYPSANRNEY